MQLRSDRLLIEYAAPGTLYRGTRFDWTGFVTQVTLDGRDTFCGSEFEDERYARGGIGLCNEFGLHQAIGYEDAGVGDLFPKLGVGVQTRSSPDAYAFVHPYATRGYPMRWRGDAQAVEIRVAPLPCRGYAALLTKRIAVTGSALDIEYRLENVGDRRLVTAEYTHNFLRPRQTGPGPELQLRVGFPVQASPALPALRFDGDRVGWPAPFSAQAFHTHLAGFAAGVPTWWELTHRSSGLRVRETVEGPVERFALWGTPRVVSPEVFVRVDVSPGAVQTWRRRYWFDVA